MKGFTFWESYFASGNELSEEEESDLYRAIIRYAFLKEEPTFSGALRSVFNAVRPNIDLSVKRSKTLKAKNSKGKQSKTKTKPNANQNETKRKPKRNQNETKKQIWSEGTDTDTDTVTDTDTFIYIPPTPSKEGDAPKVEEMGYTPELEQTVKEWLSYKREKRQGYKPTGLKSLLTQIKKHADKYGHAVVSDLIKQSMSSNYQGILWDRLLKTKSVNFPQRKYDYDALEKKMLGG